ncbi:UNVERIFIED_CONTAM: membrane-bound alpha-1,6- mannosyltransferase Initiation-specific [Siphonaria sp. JEL0065]|nr:membrane-bound alpha-1,6- mannosyltransferase Initiation-specific [Siphonaria sp. JEL0065]
MAEPYQSDALAKNNNVRWGRLKTLFVILFVFLVGTSVASNSLFVYREEIANSGPIIPPFNLLDDALGSATYPANSISNVSRASLIPQLILRTWKTSSRREIRENSDNGLDHKDRYKWFETWDKKNPSTTQIIFNDDDMDRFVRGAFSKRVVEAYFKLPRIVLRSDFARYMMLYELGGYYTDMDTSCNVPVHEWNLGMSQVAVIIGVENPGKEKDSFLQWSMASAPHHPLIANVIHRVAEKIHETDIDSLQHDDGVVLEVTGPGIWKTVIQEYLQSRGVDLTKISDMWDGYQLIGDVLILGKAYLNNDNSDNPKSLIRHHFTGFTNFGWRVHGKKSSNVTLSVAGENYDFSYIPPKNAVIVNASKSPKQIPKQIIQVANSSDPEQTTARFKEFRDTWIDKNPGYKITLMSDKDMDEYVRKEATREQKEAFFRLPLLRQRLELFRYIYLVYTGGFYTDIDTACRKPLDKWFGGYKTIGLVIGIADQSHNQGPGFIRTTIGSIPNHPVIAAFLSEKTNEINQMDASRLKTFSFFDMFENGLNQHIKNALANEGVNITHDFREMSWEGVGIVNDVLVLGQERLHASHGRSRLMYVEHFGVIWSRDKGIWKEEQESTSTEL